MITRPGLWKDPSQPKTQLDRCLKEGCKNLISHNSLHSVSQWGFQGWVGRSKNSPQVVKPGCKQAACLDLLLTHSQVFSPKTRPFSRIPLFSVLCCVIQTHHQAVRRAFHAIAPEERFLSSDGNNGPKGVNFQLFGSWRSEMQTEFWVENQSRHDHCEDIGTRVLISS